MILTISILPWLGMLIVLFMAGIIYAIYFKVPFLRQRELGDRILAKRIMKGPDEVRAELNGYFRKNFVSLSLISGAFFIVNALTALAIDIFLTSQGITYGYFGDLPLPKLPRFAVSIIASVIMCSVCWFMIASFFYWSRGEKIRLETKFFTWEHGL